MTDIENKVSYNINQVSNPETCKGEGMNDTAGLWKSHQWTTMTATVDGHCTGSMRWL